MADSAAGAFVYHDELEVAHARAAAYREALVKVREYGHDDCDIYWGKPCNCHVSIASEALKRHVEDLNHDMEAILKDCNEHN
jgi:hypothetical protein